MCGIVGFATSRADVGNHLRNTYMEQGLYIDALRGKHATGVFYGDTNSRIWFAKDAVNASQFLAQSKFSSIIDDMRAKVHFAVGHNRYATMGEHTVEDAHPFSEKSITLVHNGTLRNWRKLPSPSQGTSDSAHVAALFAEDDPGAITSLESLEGDFAFVWYDHRSRSLYFANNGRRPMSYIKGGEHLFFASEGQMITLLLSRTMAGNPVHEPKDFSPFVQYQLPCGKIDWVETEFEDKWAKQYADYGTWQGNTNHDYTTDDWRMTTNHHWQNQVEENRMQAQREVDEEGQKREPLLTFPSETDDSRTARVIRTNTLMREWDMDLRVGDDVSVSVDTHRTYETELNKQRVRPIGQVDGFYYSTVAGKETAFWATVHQVCISDLSSGKVDTVNAQLATAFVDTDGDMHMICLYKDVGMYRLNDTTTILKGTFLEKFFENQRHYYTADDTPRFTWVDSNTTLTAREVDYLLEDRICQIKQCSTPASMVPRHEIVFVDDREFVCRDCNSYGAVSGSAGEFREVTDENVTEVNFTPVDFEDDDAPWDDEAVKNKTTGTVDLIKRDDGVWVLSRAQHIYIDGAGNWVDQRSGAVIKTAEEASK